MYASPLRARRDPREAGPAYWRCLLIPQKGASRRQWWFGLVSGAFLTGFGFIGVVGVLAALADRLGLSDEPGAFSLICLVVGLFALSQFAIAADALCRRRLTERAAPHDLADAFVVTASLAMLLLLDAAARGLMGEAWPLPAPPHWLALGVKLLFLGNLVALALECGVLERSSLTELWRGRSEWRIANGK